MQRILIERSVYEPFVQKLVSKVAACRVGDPMQEGIDVGPVIDEQAAVRIENWLDEAKTSGANVLVGGKRTNAIIAPTVVAGTRPGIKLEDEEIFGPVLTVNPFDRFEDAVARANNSRYGLQGGLFTNNLRQAFQALEDWDVGGLMVNDVPSLMVGQHALRRMAGVRLWSRRHTLRDGRDDRHQASCDQLRLIAAPRRTPRPSRLEAMRGV